MCVVMIPLRRSTPQIVSQQLDPFSKHRRLVQNTEQARDLIKAPSMYDKISLTILEVLYVAATPHLSHYAYGPICAHLAFSAREAI